MANEQDTPEARKARADALRRARDTRNDSIHEAGEEPEDSPASSPPATDDAADGPEAEQPNFVDWIDRKMRGS